MPKKLQQQTEQNDPPLSREARKNEQICRMIERAEKQRLKREEKKKLAVLNKAAGKVGIGRKQKKMGMLSPKSTQVVINILFSDKARQQNAQNRYFFERKQMIEEKQRHEQEDLWARYSMRVQQMQQQQQLQQQPQSHAPYLPAPSMIGASPSSAVRPQVSNYGTAQMMPQMFTTAANGTNAAFVPPAAMSMMQQFNQTAQFQLQTTQQAAATSQCYLNAGETGGNYEGGNEDPSGSSYLSSASKQQQMQQQQQRTTSNAATLSAQNEAHTTVLPKQISEIERAVSLVSRNEVAARMRTNMAESSPLHPLLVMAKHSAASLPSLGEVLNELPPYWMPSKSSTSILEDQRQQEQVAEETKEQVKIDVQLNKNEPAASLQQKAISKNEAKQTATAPAQLTEVEKILALTRSKMQQKRTS